MSSDNSCTVVPFAPKRFEKIAKEFVNIYSKSRKDSAIFLIECNLTEEDYITLRPLIREEFLRRGWSFNDSV